MHFRSLTIRRRHITRLLVFCAFIGMLIWAYQVLLVPKIDLAPNSPMAVTSLQVYTLKQGNEVGPVELGNKVQFILNIRPGLIPISEVYAETPVPKLEIYAHQQPARIEFTPEAGVHRYLSKEYKLLPIGETYGPSGADELRDIRFVVRNRWGIQREVRLWLRVSPESSRSTVS